MMNNSNVFTDMDSTMDMQTSSLRCHDIGELVKQLNEHAMAQKPDVIESSTQTILTDNKLGKGGMGSILIGTQNIPKREVAAKVLLENTVENRLNLLHEANIIGQLEHPNIVPIHEVLIDEDGSIQIIMKKIQGTTLRRFIDKTSDHTTRMKKGIKALIQVCQALELAHSHRIIHRDIKCANIMVGEFHEVYLMDWGLALELNKPRGVTDKIVGTPTHLAPEMLSGDQTKVDERTDIYLLGATLHYVLLQKSRHRANTIEEVLELAKESKPINYPDFIPQNLADIANKACAQDPADRFQSALEFRHALENSLIVWDALKLCEKANDKMEFLKSLKLDANFSEDDFHDINYNFTRVLTTYETALDLCGNFQVAQKGVEEARTFMLRFYLAQNKPQQALNLYKQLGSEDPELELQIKTKINEKRAMSKETSSPSAPSSSSSEEPTIRRNHLLYATIVGMIAGAAFYASFS